LVTHELGFTEDSKKLSFRMHYLPATCASIPKYFADTDEYAAL